MAHLPPDDLEHILRHTADLWEDLRGQSVFLTGGTGFVGSWLLESLLFATDRYDLGVRATVLTRNAAAFHRKEPHLAAHPAVRLLEGRTADFAFPAGDSPFIIHAAVEPARAPDASHPMGMYEADVAGTRHVLEFARAHGARRFLFTSSGAVYGPQPPDMSCLPEDYAGAPASVDPASSYGQAKRAGEFMCTMVGRACGFDATIARLFAFVGPRLPLDAHYAAGNFIGDALRGRPIRIAGNGTPRRSYLYAADLALWLWTILLRGKAAHPYNVGSSHDLSIEDLARSVVRAAGTDASIEIAGKAVTGAAPQRYVPDTARAETELGLRPAITVADGLRRTLEWHRGLTDRRKAKPPTTIRPPV